MAAIYLGCGGAVGAFLSFNPIGEDGWLAIIVVLVIVVCILTSRQRHHHEAE